MLLEKFQNQRQISVCLLARGVYFLSVMSNENKQTLRFAKT